MEALALSALSSSLPDLPGVSTVPIQVLASGTPDSQLLVYAILSLSVQARKDPGWRVHSHTWPENEEMPIMQKNLSFLSEYTLGQLCSFGRTTLVATMAGSHLVLLYTCAWCLALSLLATRVCLLHHQGLSLVFTFSDMGTLPLLFAFEQVSRSNPALTLL